MGKAIVIVALILLLTGIVLAVFTQERTVEGILDSWDPITPSKFYPQNATHWVFMVKTSGGTFLELNIVASDVVRVRIGTYTIDEVTGGILWGETFVFDQNGTRFTQRVAIAGTGANFLEIKNEGTNIVNVSGNIKKIGDIRQTFHPYSGLGTLAVLLGLTLLIYGVSAKPKKRRFKGNSITSALRLSDEKIF